MQYPCHFFRYTAQPKNKPLVIKDYNDFMLGVDRMDQMVAYYNFEHKSIKWWRKVFFWVLEVIIVNSYAIYKRMNCHTGNKLLTHKKYRKILVKTLAEPQQLSSIRRSEPRVPSHMERLQPQRHRLTKGPKRRDCAVCSNREVRGNRHLTRYVCSTCTHKPALCPGECFDRFHTLRNFRN